MLIMLTEKDIEKENREHSQTSIAVVLWEWDCWSMFLFDIEISKLFEINVG